jgi:NAD(P)-dependent dehydrogenase (short-subunit alcohol dehydrogenase family)
MSRTYVVTGSASGIGKATKEFLESEGNRVIGIDRSGADIDLDLADADQRATIADRVAALTDGVVDGVIAVAGVSAPTIDGVHVNFFGARDTLVNLRPLLARSSAPRAVVVSSISSIHPDNPALTAALAVGEDEGALTIAAELVESGQGFFIYTSTKRAISEWIRQTAITDDWAGAGIPLNNFAPATIVTPMTAPHLETEEGRAMVQKTTPMPLHGPAQPIVAARALAWLTSEANSHITGQAIFLDGGTEAVLRGPKVFEGVSMADMMARN